MVCRRAVDATQQRIGVDRRRARDGTGDERVQVHRRTAHRSNTPSIESVVLPITASRMIASRIRSTRPLFCESTSRKPRPADEAMSSAATRNSHDWASPRRSPEMTDGRTAGSWIVREEPDAAQAERAAGLDQVAVDVAERAGDGRVDREERPDGDERDLGSLPDLEPQDEQRDPGQRRDRPDRAEGRPEEQVPRPGEPGDGAEEQAERRADGEPDQDPLGRDQDEAPERAALDELDGSVEDASRRWQLDDREPPERRSTPATARGSRAAGWRR